MKTLIKNGKVVNYNSVVLADVITDGDIITAVVPKAAGMYQTPTGDAVEYDRTIDAEGCYVFPGFIDTHTHFDLDLGYAKTADDFKSGSRAALLGGTTTVLDFATQDKGGTLLGALNKWHEKAEVSYCNYGFHMAIADWNAATAAELPMMIEQGITSYKLYMVYEGLRMGDADIYSALKTIFEAGGICGVHCENWELIQRRITELKVGGTTAPIGHARSRPNPVEAEAIARLMRIAQLAETPCWVVHVSTKEGMEEIRRARARGQRVYAETCPQYLLLTDDCYRQADGVKYVMCPPLRHHEDCRALWKSITAGAVDFVGTDHCSFNMAQKLRGKRDFTLIPNGVGGVGDRPRLIFTYGVASQPKRMTLLDMVKVLSYNAANVFGMKGYGEIAAGAHADIVVWDPSVEDTITDTHHYHNCDNSPFSGFVVKGRARDVLLNGNIAVKNGETVGEPKGKFIKRAPTRR